MRELSTLVHELTHSTVTNKNVRVVVSSDNMFHIADNSGMTVQHFSKGVKETGRDGRPALDNFFEEAFVEETAARWREEFFPEVSGNPRASFNAGPIRLPARYFSINWRSDSEIYQAHTNNAVYAAYAVALLGDAINVDLYELIRQTRIPGQLASAKRDFIRAINSIDNTLYRDLRDLPYTADDFLKGLARVQGIVDAKTSQPNK